MTNDPDLLQILADAKQLACRYRQKTGKPLGVTGEVAEFEAARLLDLQLTPARQAGYDAIEEIEGVKRYVQIKGRCVARENKKSQRLGQIRKDKEWDSLLMVLLDENFDAYEIWEASRAEVVEALERPGSRSRNERGALAVSTIKSFKHRRWPCP